MATNRARFTINTTPSEDPTTGDPGYDAVTSETLTLTLEENPASVLSVTYSVYSSADLSSPLASKNAPAITFDGSGTYTETLTDVNGSVTIDMPSTDGNSYIIRCSVGTPDGAEVYERMAVVPETSTTPDIRKTVPAETGQYEARGFSDTFNDMVDALANSGAAGGGTLDDAYDFGGAGVGRAINVDTGAVNLITNASEGMRIDGDASTNNKMTIAATALNGGLLEVGNMCAVKIEYQGETVAGSDPVFWIDNQSSTDPYDCLTISQGYAHSGYTDTSAVANIFLESSGVTTESIIKSDAAIAMVSVVDSATAPVPAMRVIHSTAGANAGASTYVQAITTAGSNAATAVLSADSFGGDSITLIESSATSGTSEIRFLDDGNTNWTQGHVTLTDGSTTEWDAYSTLYGEVSIFDAITQAATVHSTFLGLTDTPSSFTNQNAIYTVNGTPTPNAVFESTVILTVAGNTFNIAQGTTTFSVSTSSTIDQDLQAIASPNWANISVGSGTPAYVDLSGGDVYTTDDLEVAGTAYHAGLTFMYNHAYFDSAAAFAWQISAVDAMVFRAKSDATHSSFNVAVQSNLNRNIVITDYANRDQTHGHTIQANPTLWIHSSTLSTTEYGSFHHDQTNFRIQTGAGNVTIGTGSSVWGYNSTGDFVVTGNTELKGITRNLGATYMHSSLIMADGQTFYFNTTAAGGRMRSYNTLNQLSFLLGPPEGRHIVFGDVANGANKDYGHTTVPDPTVFIHSVVDPTVDATQWGALYHDQSVLRITTGLGNTSIGTGSATAATGIGSLYVTDELETGSVATFGAHLNLAQISAPSPTTDNLYNVAGDLYWNGNLIGTSGNDLWESATNGNVDTGTTAIDTIAATADGGAVWFVNASKGTNNRAGMIICSWDYSANTINDSSEIGMASVGTVDITYTVTMSGGTVSLNAVATSDDWKVSVIRTVAI